MSNATRKEVTKSKVQIKKDAQGKLRIYVGPNQKQGSKTVELVQYIKTVSYYKSKQYNDNLQDSLFAEDDFDAPEQEYTNTETRVAWVTVPSKYSEEQIVAMVKKFENTACIQRVLSNHPILTEGQERAIASVELDFDLNDVAMSQVVRNKQEEVVLDNAGKIQYKKNLFFKTEKEDVDLRGNGEEYQPDFLLAEVEGAGALDPFQNL